MLLYANQTAEKRPIQTVSIYLELEKFPCIKIYGSNPFSIYANGSFGRHIYFFTGCTLYSKYNMYLSCLHLNSHSNVYSREKESVMRLVKIG